MIPVPATRYARASMLLKIFASASSAYFLAFYSAHTIEYARSCMKRQTGPQLHFRYEYWWILLVTLGWGVNKSGIVLHKSPIPHDWHSVEYVTNTENFNLLNRFSPVIFGRKHLKDIYGVPYSRGDVCSAYLC